MPRLRGAFPSPRHRLAGAMPHRIVGSTPAQFLWFPKKLSMWLNDTYGDCVTAEEAFNKACADPEIFITDAEVKAWAKAHGFLNGALLPDVMELMRTAGFSQNGKTYDDGPHASVDWTQDDVLRNAISIGPVKIGVAADQLEKAIPGDPPPNGWFASGFTKDENEDHCVALCGFGSIGWLFSQLGVPVPTGVDVAQSAYGLFTWGSVGVIDRASMMAITAEAWLRNPGTVIA